MFIYLFANVLKKMKFKLYTVLSRRFVVQNINFSGYLPKYRDCIQTSNHLTFDTQHMRKHVCF